MKHVHYAVRVIEEALYVIVISYTEDEDEMIEITRVTIHPVGKNGVLEENSVEDPEDITPVMFEDAIKILEEDGCIDGDYVGPEDLDD